MLNNNVFSQTLNVSNSKCLKHQATFLMHLCAKQKKRSPVSFAKYSNVRLCLNLRAVTAVGEWQVR